MTETPLMRQYWDIKSLHPDKILLFRMGDFFEMFFEDAVQAAPLLGIALTSRNKKSADETPMCGVPYHSIAGPINKLLAARKKIAICDQIEDPKLAKGLVKRAVTRILTPGMVYDSENLEASRSHYLAAWDESTLACWDATTDEAFYFRFVHEKELLRLLALLPIAEWVTESLSLAPEGFSFSVSEHRLAHGDGPQPKAIQRLLSYWSSAHPTEGTQTKDVAFQERVLAGVMDLSATTLRHLEIFEDLSGRLDSCLYETVRRTQTAAGGRLLRQRLNFPLTSLVQIEERLSDVSRWVTDLPRTRQIRDLLSRMNDIERRLGKISQNTCSPLDLRALADSLQYSFEALNVAQLSVRNAEKLRLLQQRIETTIVTEPPAQLRQGGVIQKGCNAELDRWIELATESQSLVLALEEREKTATGIGSLKIRYNNVFGFYIEVTHTHKDRVPSRYQRKQTLANAERFCTDELVELERQVLSAQTRRQELELALFEQLRLEIGAHKGDILALAAQVAELDVATANAWLAIEKKHVRPEFTDGGLSLQLARHPVVEQMLQKSQQRFVPNNLELKKGECCLITGPNMAGKSTLMRQVALIALMAQTGMFVPATVARLPIFEHCFTRIGASDQLARGLSTFMVEMTETAEMLSKASPRSLLILDEIGRGTSTHDGLSLAQAILEHLLEKVGALTLFATHYHELTNLAVKFPQLLNAHMQVREQNGEVHFLHTLTPGATEKSYGIYVAKIAGVPVGVVKRAQRLLQQFESQKQNFQSPQLNLLDFQDEPNPPAVAPSPVLSELQKIEISSLTPLQALNKLHELQTLNQLHEPQALNQLPR